MPGLESLVNSSKNLFKKVKKEVKNLPYYLLFSSMVYLGCNDKESKPSEVNDPPKDPPIVYQGNQGKGKTNEKGEIIFKEKSTGEDVTISVLNDRAVPVKNIEVVYIDGDSYETFIATDPSENYLPSFNIFEHNSSHELRVYPFDWEWLSTSINKATSIFKYIKKELLTDGEGCNSTDYIRTVSGKQYYNYYKVRNGINIFVLTQFGMEPIVKVIESLGKTNDFLGETFDFDEEAYFKSTNWDQYIITSSPGNLITTTRYVDVQSNPPWISNLETIVRGDSIYFSWKGNDKEDYGTISNFKDLTICEGPTTGSDLVYEPRIMTPDGFVITSWQTNQNKLARKIFQNGNFSFEVGVEDEVGNKNVSERRSFSIPSYLNDTLIIQPDSLHGKDAAVEVELQNGNPNPIRGANDNYDHGGIAVWRYEIGDYYWISRAYLEFNLKDLSPNKEIKSAKLKVYGSMGGYDSFANVELRKVTSSWTEKGVTWANQPTMENFSISRIYVDNLIYDEWYEFDVTNLVNQWKSGVTNNGVVLKLIPEEENGQNIGDKHFNFKTSETDIYEYVGSKPRPKLEIIYK